MEYDRAVRLKELWNGSFRLNLQIKTDFEYGFNLYGNRNETSDDSLVILKHLTDRLHLKLKVNYANYTIG